MNTQDTPQAMTNREMAAVLFNIATVLRQQGNVNPFRTAAYERGARALMFLVREAAGGEAAEILRDAAAVPFRRRWHVGAKLQAKIKEMAARGQLDQYAALLAELPPHQAGLMSVPGVGPKTADRVHAALGIADADDLIRAARDGRLRQVRGFGAVRTSAIASLPVAAGGQVVQPSLFD